MRCNLEEMSRRICVSTFFFVKCMPNNKKAQQENLLSLYLSGPDGIRTRDPMRDRHVF